MARQTDNRASHRVRRPRMGLERLEDRAVPAYTATLSGTTATFTGDAAGDALMIDAVGGQLRHNRAGDPGFNSALDFDTAVAGDQTLAAGATAVVNVNAGAGDDTITFADGVPLGGALDAGAGLDTIDYSAFTTPVAVNLGVNAPGLIATLGADQEVPPTTNTATGTASITYDNVTRLFNINVTVEGIPAADVTGFHIHRGAFGINGPIIVDFGTGGLTPTATGFTFAATGVALDPLHEAALLGGLTYLNVHTAAFPNGAIRGQIVPAGRFVEAPGTATGTSGVSNIENATGGSGSFTVGAATFGDGLVGSKLFDVFNFLRGGPGNDVLVGALGNDVLWGEDGDEVLDFFGIEDPNFRGGARAAVGDVNGDGIGDILVAAGFSGGPRVAVFNGVTLFDPRTSPSPLPPKLFGDFFIFEPTLRNGVFVASGDLDGDAFAEVIAGGGPGGGPRVFALSGKGLLGGTQTQLANFFAGDTASRGGIRLAVKNLDGDFRADLVTGAGTGAGSRVTGYLGSTIPTDGTPHRSNSRSTPSRGSSAGSSSGSVLCGRDTPVPAVRSSLASSGGGYPLSRTYTGSYTHHRLARHPENTACPMVAQDNSPASGLQESFATACGMTDPFEVTATHRDTGVSQTHQIDRPYVFIGRARSMGVRLDDPSVSQCHAYLQIVGGAPYCVDLGSRKGVVWDDGGEARGWVIPGRTLRIGQFDVVIGGPGVRSAPETSSGGEFDLPAIAEVHTPECGPAGRHSLDRPVTLVGRHPNCDLRLLSDTVPYFQCTLVGTPGGVWCVDIWSVKGTILNGRTIRLARVRDGDLVEVGRASLVVRTGPESIRPPAPDTATGPAAAEALAAIPQMVQESVSGAFTPFREALDHFQRFQADVAQTLAAVRREHAETMEEQARLVQELTRDLRELRADVERGGTAVQAFATAKQEQESAISEQLRQVQDLVRELRPGIEPTGPERNPEGQADLTQTLAMVRQEHAATMSEQAQLVQGLMRELRELRADVEQRGAEARTFATAQQEDAAALGEQLRQVQELARELRAEVGRTGLEQSQPGLEDVTRALATARQEQAAAAGEQARLVEELARQLRELRADVDRRGAEVGTFATAQQEYGSVLGEQLRQVQDLVRGLREDYPREPAASSDPVPLVKVEPAPPPIPVAPPPPPPPVAQVPRAQPAIDAQTWSLDRLALTVPPQFGTLPRTGSVQRAGAVQAEEDAEKRAGEAAATKTEPVAAGRPAEWRLAEIEMGNEILTSVLNERRAKLGPDHPDTLATLNDLAAGYRDAGRWDKALPLLEESLSLHTTSLGPDHPATLVATGDLAGAYLAAKQVEKSLPLLERYVPKLRHHLGAGTPRFAGLLAVISYDLLTTRQYPLAETYLRECLGVLERSKPDGWVTNQVRSMLGGSLLGQQKYAEAEPLLLAGYQGMRRHRLTVPPQDKGRLREAADRLAELYAAVGQPEQAARWRAEGVDSSAPAPPRAV